MDFQNRVGSKTGGGGVLSKEESNIERRERLRRLALETIDLAKDPYFMRNHLGSYECKLCLTLHVNEGSYLAHTQGKKHQANLARRAAKEAKEGGGGSTTTTTNISSSFGFPARPTDGPSSLPKKTIKIGRPGYKVTKIKDPHNGHLGLLFQIDYPEIVGHDKKPSENNLERDTGMMEEEDDDDSHTIHQPRYRFMSCFEQKQEMPDRRFQYVLFAAEPYETIAFKISSGEIDRRENHFLSYWDKENRSFTLQLFYRHERNPMSGMGTM